MTSSKEQWDESLDKLQRELWYAWHDAEIYRSAHALADLLRDGQVGAPGERERFRTNVRSVLASHSRGILAMAKELVTQIPFSSYASTRFLMATTGQGTENVEPTRLEAYRDSIVERALLCLELDETWIQRVNQGMDGRIYGQLKERGAMLRPYLTVELEFVIRELIRIHHQWAKRKSPLGTFEDALGTERFKVLRQVMQELGISPKVGKGKNRVVACLHAAFETYGIRLPRAGEWQELLRNTYPGSSWSAKSVPEERASQRTKSYAEAYKATKDRLA